jgi:hypothetical protein
MIIHHRPFTFFRPAAVDLYTPSGIYIGSHRRTRESIARNFLNWGGFYEFQPIERTMPITEAMLSVKSNIDHIRMRKCLRKWSQVIGVPNPYEYQTGANNPSQLPTDSQRSTIETTVTQPLAKSDEIKVEQPVPTEWKTMFESDSDDDCPTPSAITTPEKDPYGLSQTRSMVAPTASPSVSSRPTLELESTLDKASSMAQQIKPAAQSQAQPSYSKKAAAQIRIAKDILREEEQRQKQKATSKDEKGSKGEKGGKRSMGPTNPKEPMQPVKKPKEGEHMTERLKNFVRGWF